MAVCFDVEGGTFRDEIYSEYKAGREKKPQEERPHPRGRPGPFVMGITLRVTSSAECRRAVLSELSAQPRKSPIFTITEAVNPECANTNGG